MNRSAGLSYLGNSDPIDPILKLLIQTWYFPQEKNKDVVKHLGLNNLTPNEISSMWKHMWFAKEMRQKEIDQMLKKQFEHHIDHYAQLVENTDHTFSIWEKLGLMILFDQVTRNVYRNSAKAYMYDKYAIVIAREFMEMFDLLPYVVKVTVALCYVHSEDISDHIAIEHIPKKLSESVFNHPMVNQSLSAIMANHRDRIETFGRVPERNRYLGRVSSTEEKVYMKSFN